MAQKLFICLPLEVTYSCVDVVYSWYVTILSISIGKCYYHTALRFLSLTISIKYTAKARTITLTHQIQSQTVLSFPALPKHEFCPRRFNIQNGIRKTEKDHSPWKALLDQDIRAVQQSPRKRPGICHTWHFSHFYTWCCSDLRDLSCSHHLFPACSKLGHCVQNTSASCVFTFPHLQPVHTRNIALLGPYLLKQGCKIMRRLCWSMIKDVSDSTLSPMFQLVKEWGDAPQRVLATNATKAKSMWNRKNMLEFFPCHPRCCFSYFLSCLPTTHKAILVISHGRQQILKQAVVHCLYLLGEIPGIPTARSSPCSGSTTDFKGLWKLLE